LTRNVLNAQSYQTFLRGCFKVRVPDNDESFVAIFPGSFMMTNKHLYIYTNTRRDTLHHIHLCEIASYENEGEWIKSGTLTLNDGKVIQFKLDAMPDEKVVRQLQEMLDCEHLIET